MKKLILLGLWLASSVAFAQHVVPAGAYVGTGKWWNQSGEQGQILLIYIAKGNSNEEGFEGYNLGVLSDGRIYSGNVQYAYTGQNYNILFTYLDQQGQPQQAVVGSGTSPIANSYATKELIWKADPTTFAPIDKVVETGYWDQNSLTRQGQIFRVVAPQGSTQYRVVLAKVELSVAMRRITALAKRHNKPNQIPKVFLPALN